VVMLWRWRHDKHPVPRPVRNTFNRTIRRHHHTSAAAQRASSAAHSVVFQSSTEERVNNDRNLAIQVRSRQIRCWNVSLRATLPPGGVQSVYVCLFVCLSARITRKPRSRTLPNFSCMLPFAKTQSFYDGVGISYVLPVLWMTSSFHTMRPLGQNQAQRYVRRSSPGGGTSWTSDHYSVWLSSSECGTVPEAKSAIYDFLVFCLCSNSIA